MIIQRTSRSPPKLMKLTKDNDFGTSTIKHQFVTCVSVINMVTDAGDGKATVKQGNSSEGRKCIMDDDEAVPKGSCHR